MRIFLRRFFATAEETVGELLDGAGFRLCLTLEDQARRGHKKVYAETAIPEGEYPITLRAHGGFYTRYRDRFGDWHHRGMLELTNVPNFKNVLIHCGNDDDDTAGCPLVGDRLELSDDGHCRVLSSGNAYQRIYPALAEQAESGPLTLIVRNRFGILRAVDDEADRKAEVAKLLRREVEIAD